MPTAINLRLRWLISCPCGLCCSDGWTRVWLFPMPRPGRLHSQWFLLPEMMTPHPGGPRLHLGRQTDDPGRQWDGPGHLWEEPGGWTTLESPLIPVLQSEVLHRLIHLRDASPVNFSAVLDPEDKVKERSITDNEDEDGDHKKVSAAQYQLFRQGVTTSKGSFKVNPAKTRRASRQWSHRSGILVGPAFSQGYYGLYCPYCPRSQGRWRGREDNVIRDTEYHFYIQAPHGETDLPKRTIQTQGPPRCSVRTETSRWQRLQRFQGTFLLPDVPSYVLRYWWVGQEVSDICFSRWLHGGICHRGTISQGREDEASEGEVGHYPGSPGLSGVSRLCSCFQSSAVAPWRLAEELRVPASGPVYSENCTIWGLPCARSTAQGPSEPSANHQASRQDGWVVSHVHPEAPWVQVQHESDVIKEDCF